MMVPRQFFRYLPIYPEIEDWGARVLDAGCTKIPAGAIYPAPGHPDDHHFSWEEGRRLQAYTFVYITSGTGLFDSEASGPLPIGPGQIFVLFPGVWHRYRPAAETGWDEYWVECEGHLLEAAVRHTGLKPAQPVLEVGHDDDLLATFLGILTTIRAEPPGFQAIIGLQSVVIVARIRSLIKNALEEGSTTEQKLVRRAINLMLESLGGAISWEDLSRKLGVSYSTFRRIFRKATGKSPGDYFIEMKINRAKQLLEDPARAVQEIAQLLGFESSSYFSHLFKARVGIAPSAHRSRAGRQPAAAVRAE